MRALIVWLALASAAYADAPIGDARAAGGDSRAARGEWRAADGALRFDVKMVPPDPDAFAVRLIGVGVRCVRAAGKTAWTRTLPDRWRKAEFVEAPQYDRDRLRVTRQYNVTARADAFVIADEGGVLVLDRADGHTRLAWDAPRSDREWFFYDRGTVTIDSPTGHCKEEVGGTFVVTCDGRLYWSSGGTIAAFDGALYRLIATSTFKERKRATGRGAMFEADADAGDARVWLRAIIFD